MQKDPAHATHSPDQWAALPPRDTNPQDLFDLIDGQPKRIDGKCICCDSNVSGEWCTASSTKSQATEIRHLAEPDMGILRPSELALILQNLP